MTPADVHALAVAAGLTRDSAVIATAIAWAESNLKPDVMGDVALQDDTWGPSCGLWQVRSLKADSGTGRARDFQRLFDPVFNARAMATISAGGASWTPWSMFKNGRYLEHVDAVRAAVKGPPMRFVSRSEWGARTATTSTNITPDGVAVHWEGPHMGSFPHSSCAGLVRGIQAFHMDTRGWADIAYSAIACPHGYVFEGRGPGHRTAANGTDDGNQRYYAVCFLGGEDDVFTLTGQEAASGRHDDQMADRLDAILQESLAGLTDALAELVAAADEGSARQAINDAIDWLGAGEVVGHRDITSTACPGDEIYAWAHAGHPSPGGIPAPPTPPAPQPQQEDDDTMRLIGVTNNRGIFLVSASLQASGKGKGKATARYVGTPEEVEALVAAGVVPGYNKQPDLPEALFDKTFTVVG